jgi:hypothetical protein
VLILFAGSAVAEAQATGSLTPLDGRASASLKAQVGAVADSLVRAGLPVGPVVDKTLEGLSKGAGEQRIMVAVRGVATELRVARGALGPSSDHELAAAVAALRAGSGPATLGELRKQLPGRSLVVPLSVLTSLLVDGAPASSATVAVVATAKQRDDANLLAYGQAVSRDIASGVAPLTAITSARGSTIALNSLSGPGRGAQGSPSPIKSKPKPRP